MLYLNKKRTLQFCNWRIARRKLRSLSTAILLAKDLGKLKVSRWEIFKRIFSIVSMEGEPTLTTSMIQYLMSLIIYEEISIKLILIYLIIKQRDRKGGNTLPEFSQMRIKRHLDTYFSIVLLRAAWASLVRLSTLLIITVLKDLLKALLLGLRVQLVSASYFFKQGLY